MVKTKKRIFAAVMVLMIGISCLILPASADSVDISDDGYYRVPVTMLSAASSNASMAAGALDSAAYIRTTNGVSTIYLSWTTIELSGYYGNITSLKYYTQAQSGTWDTTYLEDTTTQSTRPANSGLLASPTTSEVPEVISFTLPWVDSDIYYVQVTVDAMDSMMGQSYPQNARLQVDYDNIVDLTALEQALTQANDIDGSAYTSESYSALQSAIATAQAVFESAEATQADVDAHTTALGTAINNLEAASNIEDGKNYVVPVKAWKESADEPSMMASLIYEYAYVEMVDGEIYATFYMVPTTIMYTPIYPTAVGGVQYLNEDGDYVDAIFEVYDELTQVKAVKIKLQSLDTPIPIVFTQSDYGSNIRLKFYPESAVEGTAPVFEEVEVFTGSYKDIEWVNSFGGAKLDYITGSAQLTNGDFVVVGYTSSTDGDFTDLNKGSADGYIVRYSESGELKSIFTVGSASSDYINDIIATDDGGYIVTGDYSTIAGDFSSLSNTGGYDVFVAKYNSEDELTDIFGYGGSGNDYSETIQTTADGGYIVTGSTSSTDGDFDVAGYSGMYSDVFVMKLDSSFAVEWTQCVGGSSLDYSGAIVELEDGSFMLGGYTHSKDVAFDGLAHYGTYDIYLAKLNGKNGNIDNVYKYGATKNAYFENMVLLSDGTLLVTGSVTSDGYDFDGIDEVGKEDGLLMNISTDGTVNWIKTITTGYTTDGTKESNTIIANFAYETDYGYVVGGYSQAERGIFTGQNRGGADLFIAKFNFDGELISIDNIGGTDVDYMRSFMIASDGSYFMVAQTKSVDVDFSEVINQGSYDIVAVKTTARTFDIIKAELEEYISQAEGIIQINYTEESYEVLQNALESAKTVLDNSESTKAEMEEQITALKAALEQLVYEDADYSAVESALAKVPADLSGYTSESVANLNAAIDAVVYGKNITEQGEVDAMAMAIENAITALKAISSSEDENPSEDNSVDSTDNSKESGASDGTSNNTTSTSSTTSNGVETGNNQSVILYAFFAIAALGFIVYIAKKKRVS